MFNSAAGDHAQIELRSPTGAPTIQAVVDDGAGKRTDGGSVPAITARSYLKSGRLSFLLINRNPDVEYPVIVRTTEATASYRRTTLAASSAERGMLVGLGLLPAEPGQRDVTRIFEAVQPIVARVKSSEGTVPVTLPPASIVTLEPIVDEQD